MQYIAHLLAQQSTGGGAGFAIGGGIFFTIVVIATSLFWLWMLIDALTSSKPSTEKLIWVLVILFTHILGAVLYFVIGRSGRNA